MEVTTQSSSPALPFSRWTRVPCDDKVLTRLVELFFAWDNTVSRLIDQTMFIEDLSNSHNRGDASELTLCTSFLVNALLAMSSVRLLLGPCVHLDSPCPLYDRSTPSWMGL